MKDLYLIAGVSKQALWKHKKRSLYKDSVTTHAVRIMTDIRKRHKRMSCRKMYYASSETLPVGRDIFEQIGFRNGFKVKVKRNAIKTTCGQRVEVYPNLIAGLVLNNINQVWQSDIIYIAIAGKHSYGFTIIDVYSRKLLAVHIAKQMTADELLKAVKKAFESRAGTHLQGCIIHSDRGSQYISGEYKQIIRQNKMQLSMCKMPQENAYAERVQGTIKNEYMYEEQLTQQNIQRIANRTIKYYNEERPHNVLGNKTPTAFEKMITKMVKNTRPQMQLHKGFQALSTFN